jgi:beta-xylosidase
MDRDFPDPDVLSLADGYVAFATGSNGIHVQRARSTTLTDWSNPNEALPVLPTWVNPSTPDVWAPSVVQQGSGFVMAFTAKSAATGRHCIGIATSQSVDGSFAGSAAPLLCDDAAGGVIDPDIYVADGTAVLLWKIDGNCCGRPTSIWSQPFDLASSRLSGAATKLISVDQAWERSASPSETTVEAPDLVRVGQRLFLFYSGNGYATANYAEGYAVCASPDGPCTKPRSTPVLGATADVAGPGGGVVFEANSGSWLIAYQAWRGNAVGYDAGGSRSLRVDQVRFIGDLVAVDGPTSAPAPRDW